MSKLLFPVEKGGNVANRKRFDEEFESPEAERGNKPDDFYDTFAGNKRKKNWLQAFKKIPVDI